MHWKVLRGNSYNTHNAVNTDCLFNAVEQNNISGAKILLVECHSNPNVTDKQGKTLLDLTNVPEVEILLLKYGAKAENVYKSHNKIIGKLSSERPPDNSLPIFIIGDSGVGKSTMLKSLLSTKGFLAVFAKAKPVSSVGEKTVGIIPYEVVTKEFGKVIYYDFAGHQVFYASHCAVLENTVQTSPPIVIYLTHLQNSEQKIADSTAWWMNLVQNQCTNLTGKAHVIVVGGHADKVKECGEDPQDKESLFALIIEKFPKLQFVAFTPIDCRFPDSDQMKEVRKQIQKSSTILRSTETLSLNAHAFYIYLLQSFKNDLAVSLKEVKQRILSDSDIAQSKRAKDILSFIPSTFSCLVDICDQLNKKGLILYLHNEASPEMSFIVCDRVKLLSRVTGTIFAPKTFQQHCSLASNTGIAPFSKYIAAFKEYDIEILKALLSHLELCFEISDKGVLDRVRKLDENPEPDSRYLFFPGLIKIDTPEQLWKDDPNMNYHFGWIIQIFQDTEFFDPRCFQVLILRLVFTFGLTPAASMQDKLYIQQCCSVWKKGIIWVNEDGVTSHLELTDNGKSLFFKMQSLNLQPSCLIQRSKIINTVLQTVADFCPNVNLVESVVDPNQIVQMPSNNFTLCSITEIAIAITAGSDTVRSNNSVLPFNHILQFEPYIGLNQVTLQSLHSEKNVRKGAKISNAFISHFTDQLTDLDLISMYIAILNPSQMSLVLPVSPRQKLIQALIMWRNETEGTYSCLRETLDKYSIFTGRNPLVRTIMN